MLPPIYSPLGQAVRLIISALVTAIFVLGLAFLLISTPERRASEVQAFQEIEAHRVVSRCAFYDMVTGLNRLLEADGLETLPPIDTQDIDCSAPPPRIADPDGSD